MNMNFDVNKVFQDRLAESMGLDKYQYIIRQVKRTDVSIDADFQRTFNGFYIVRRNEAWRKVYYGLFERVKTEKTSFESILRYMFAQTGNIEPSFSVRCLQQFSRISQYGITMWFKT